MKILLVNKFYDLRGGTERVLYDLEDGLRDRGHEVAVFSRQHPRNRASAWSRFFPPERNYENPTVREKLGHAFGTIYDFGARRALASMLSEFEPDVVHAHNIYHQLSPSIFDACRQRGVPVVLTLHDFKLACPTYNLYRDGGVCEKCIGMNWPTPLVRYRCSRGSLSESWLLALEAWWHQRRDSYQRNVREVVSPSRFLADKIRSAGFFEHRLRVIPNAPRHESQPAALDKRDLQPTLLYVGRLSQEKGIEVVVEAASRCPEVQLRVAGSGPLESKLRKATEGSPNVHLIGQCDTSTLEIERARAWAVVLPSLCYENSPLSVLEAFWSARPVISVPHGGSAELVEDGVTGRLLVDASVDSWIAEFGKVQDSAESFGRMGTWARERAEARYSFERFLDAYEEVYRRAM